MTKILIKKLHAAAIIPKYETKGSSGLDLSANLKSKIIIKPGEKCLIPTGLAVSIPQDHELQIRPRSGLAAKKSITVLNTPGTIDSDYRGEIKIILINLGKENFEITNGLRVAQMVLCPISKAELSEVDDLDKTSRDHGGFGSTGS
tara:strand:- start:757 stop:1194 length:438 start_codon:yes stop_codon:yes gene_type:complete